MKMKVKLKSDLRYSLDIISRKREEITNYKGKFGGGKTQNM